MDLYFKTTIIASIIFVWLNASTIKGFYDPYASITFEKERLNVCFPLIFFNELTIKCLIRFCGFVKI
jgi:hypothetical protein